MQEHYILDQSMYSKQKFQLLSSEIVYSGEDIADITCDKWSNLYIADRSAGEILLITGDD